MNNSDMSIQASSNMMMATCLSRFDEQSERAARQNLQAALEVAGMLQDAYTQQELRAMVKLEQLKLIGDLGLAEILLRGKIISEIENEALWSVHPNQYASMQEAAKDQGISLSEYSNIRQLYNIVFPFIVENLDVNLALLWEEIGKSNFRELTPYLVRAITGEPNQSQNVENTYAVMIEDIAVTNTASGVELTEAEMRHQVVEQLLDAGHLTNRQLRQRIRPERPPSIQVHVVDYVHDGRSRKVIISLMNDDQYSLLQRKMNRYIEINPTNMHDLAQTQFGRMIVEAS